MSLFQAKRNPWTHATLDIETLSTDANACVFEIGVAAATFKPGVTGLSDFKSCVWTFDLVDAMRCGEVSGRTIAWWISGEDIPQAVRARLRKIWNRQENRGPCDIPSSLSALNRFLADSGAISIWANGAAFDFPLVRDLFKNARRVYERNAKLVPGWGHQDEMCIRPLRRAFSPFWKWAREVVDVSAPDVLGPDSGKHAADYDCLVNLTFLEAVNRRVPLVSEETLRAFEDKPRL